MALPPWQRVGWGAFSCLLSTLHFELVSLSNIGFLEIDPLSTFPHSWAGSWCDKVRGTISCFFLSFFFFNLWLVSRAISQSSTFWTMPWSLKIVSARCDDVSSRIETAPREGVACNPSNWVCRGLWGAGSSKALVLQRRSLGTGSGQSFQEVSVDALGVQFLVPFNPGLGLGEVWGLTLSKLEQIEGAPWFFLRISPSSSKLFSKRLYSEDTALGM